MLWAVRTGVVLALAASVSGCALSHNAVNLDDAGPDVRTIVDAGVDARMMDVARVDVPLVDVPVDTPIATPDAACAASQTRCASGCADLSSDSTNCGACGNACSNVSMGTRICQSGVCVLNCNAGSHPCMGSCVDNASTTQCGPGCTACGTVANASVMCAGGTCMHVCNAGYSDNGGVCVRSPCGNNALEPTEGCDDGNNNDGDGCSATCTMEAGTVAEFCTSSIVPIVIGDLGAHFYRGTTTGAVGDDSGSTCGTAGPDVALVVTFTAPTVNFTMTATPQSAWDIVLRHDSASNCPPRYCVDTNGANIAESYAGSGSGGSVNVVIDGYHSYSAGDFVLEVDTM